MKVCPKWFFSNDESFAICAWCNRSLADVKTTPSADPGSPEHEQRIIREKRHSILGRQLRSAAILYSLAISLSGLSATPGPLVLCLLFASGMIVAGAVIWMGAGQFIAAILQGSLSLALFLHFNLLHPLIFFILAAHVFFPVLFHIWIELIFDVNR